MNMSINGSGSLTAISPLASILFGILILIFPNFLNYLIAFYLIVIGLIGFGFIGYIR